MSNHDCLNPPELPAPRGYSHAVLTRGRETLFISGQIGCDADGTVVSADLVEQFSRALENLLLVVRRGGGRPESIARLTIYVTDVTQYRTRKKEIGIAYRRTMGNHYPAMTLLEVQGLFEPGTQIELEATAVL